MKNHESNKNKFIGNSCTMHMAFDFRIDNRNCALSMNKKILT